MTFTTKTTAQLHEFAVEVLALVGTPDRQAGVVANSLVGANAVGHDSHGVVRLLEYMLFVERGQVVPDAEPSVAHSFGAVAAVDGNHGWGQPAAAYAAELAADAAQKFGIGAASVRNCNHIGRIGEYAEQLAERGLVSLIWCNADPAVAPHGGLERMLGTNPFAVGVPVPGQPPFLLDLATAAAAEGKLRVARAKGEHVPAGAIVDKFGNPSTDPEDYYDGGALLPFGGHKGYGISVFIELLGGGLSGNHPSVTSRYVIGNGAVIIALTPEAFAATDFADDVRDTVDLLRGSKPADPRSPVMIPGDVEAAVREQRGGRIPVPIRIWEDLCALRESLLAGSIAV